MFKGCIHRIKKIKPFEQRGQNILDVHPVHSAEALLVAEKLGQQHLKNIKL